LTVGQAVDFVLEHTASVTTTQELE
jgi:hypothetical protein